MGILDRVFNALHPLFTRLRTRKALFIVLAFSVSLLFLYTTALGSVISEWIPSASTFSFGSKPLPGLCTPEEYASGRWVHRPYYSRPGPLSKSDLSKPLPKFEGPVINMTGPESVMKWARVPGCASSREFQWHWAADNADHFKRFPGPLEWEWVPGGRCAGENGLREFAAEELVRELVEGGGWLLIGDSVTENQFYSLSCLLWPHVIATPDYTLNAWWDRGWPQNLYLNPESPLLKDDSTIKSSTHPLRKLNLPPNFNISGTPLATFRRVDLFWSREELVAKHKELHPEFYKNGAFDLLGDEDTWTMSPDEYLDIFTKDRPEGNYKTLLLSTAGHWTTHLFAGYHRPDDEDASKGQKPKPGEPVYGYDGLLQFFGEMMELWADKVQAKIEAGEKAKGATYPPSRTATTGLVPQQRQAIIRAYLPGHVSCHEHLKPVTEIPVIRGKYWNWDEIKNYNKIFKNLLSRDKYKNIHYLEIDRPGRLRPDAHATSDCLHIMTGAGVMEGWTHYTWHYLTREL